MAYLQSLSSPLPSLLLIVLLGLGFDNVLATRSLLDTSYTTIPELPEPEVPHLPTITTLPDPEVPHLPEIPTLPEPELPHLPKPELPSIPNLPKDLPVPSLHPLLKSNTP